MVRVTTNGEWRSGYDKLTELGVEVAETPKGGEAGEEVTAEVERGVVTKDSAERAERVAEVESKGVRIGIWQRNWHGR